MAFGAPCGNCGLRVGDHPLSRRWPALCRPCWLEKSNVNLEEEEDWDEEDERVTRRPGDPPFPCLWCLGYHCRARLSLCGDCQAWYVRRAVGMPDDDGE